MSALAKLGFAMLERGKFDANLQEVRRWAIPCDGSSLHRLLETGKHWRLLKSDGHSGEPVQYLHALFQEYFAAEYLNSALESSRSYGDVLDKRALRPEWYEVVAMVVGMCTRPDELVVWLASEIKGDIIGRIPVNSPRTLDSFVFELSLPGSVRLLYNCWQTLDAAKRIKAREAMVECLLAVLSVPHKVGQEPPSYLDFERYDVAIVREQVAATRVLSEVGDERALPLLEPLKAVGLQVAGLFPLSMWVAGAESNIRQRTQRPDAQSASAPPEGVGRPDLESYKEVLCDIASMSYALGTALVQQRQLNEAIASFRKALEIRPDDNDTLRNLGVALTEKGRLDEVIAGHYKALDKAIAASQAIVARQDKKSTI